MCRQLILFLVLVQQLAAVPVYAEQSITAPLASRSLLLDVVSTHSVSVAVGERGHILFSHDNKQWTQAQVATRQLLTSVCMLDDQTGWAVGHHAVIVKTSDGARTWQLVHQSATDEAPLLDVHFLDANTGYAVGAYGLLYVTTDAGNTWQRRDIVVTNEEVFETELLQPFDLHLNAIHQVDEQSLFIAAERGYVLRSDNGGVNWRVLATPYHGSFFGLLPLSSEALLVFGLRGHLYLSSNAGSDWAQIDTGTTAMLTDAVLINDQHIVISGAAGTLISASRADFVFKPILLSHRHDLSALAPVDDKSVLVTGEAGITLIDIDSPAGSK